jgi:O-antigen ligase
VAERSPPEAPGRRWYREAHNDYLQLAVETGVVGIALLLWGLAVLLRSLRDPWLGAAVIGALVHSAVDFPLQIPAVAALFFTVCAFAARPTGDPAGRAPFA